MVNGQWSKVKGLMAIFNEKNINNPWQWHQSFRLPQQFK